MSDEEATEVEVEAPEARPEAVPPGPPQVPPAPDPVTNEPLPGPMGDVPLWRTLSKPQREDLAGRWINKILDDLACDLVVVSQEIATADPETFITKRRPGVRALDAPRR